MSKHLVVVHPFGDYQRGEKIEGDAVETVLATHRHSVVPVEVEDPAPKSKPADKA
jgi:hypothetical protein